MAVANDPKLVSGMRLLRSHGITTNPQEMDIRPDNEIWNYQQISLGYNYRMTELQAALGLSQIKRLDFYVDKRHELAKRYDELLKNVEVMIPYQHPDAYSAYHLYPIQIRLENDADTRRNIYEGLLIKDIKVNIHYIPIHRQPFYARQGFSVGDFRNAENYYAATLSLPLYPNLSEADQNFVIQTLKSLVT